MSEEQPKYEVSTISQMGLTSSLVDPGQIVLALRHVQRLMKEAMTPAVIENGKITRDGDYGLIPGCGDKPALRKSGAEILLIGFGLVAHMRTPIFKDLPGGHREVIIETEIRHMGSGLLHAIGVGSCSTMESKYRWRNSERCCPACGQPSIIKGKEEYGGGWLCWAKKGGCNQKYAEGDPAIEDQRVGREENLDIADVYNTVLKIAAKRSAVDGSIKATGSSGMFTQDVDDLPPSSLGGTEHSERPAGKEERQDKKVKPFKCAVSNKLAPAYCSLCKEAQNPKCPLLPVSAEGGEQQDYTEYVKQIDRLEGADAVLSWMDNIREGARANLPAEDYQKLESYASQMVDIWGEKK